MANGGEFAPDYPTAPAPRRPVDNQTLRQMAGAQMMYGGLGKVFSATESGPAAAATRAAYARIGAEAAEQMRNRFYKKEWEQVHSTRIKPLLEQLNQMKEIYEAQTAVAVRPTPRTVSREEGALIAQQDTKVIPGKKTKEGGDSGPTIQPGTDPAIAPGQVGAIAMEDKLSIVNPDTGLPVALDSPEGFAAQQKLVDQFWRGYENINVQIMDVLGEYQGNPFVDHAAGTMIENVMKQAGHGVTGQMDPLEQQQYMDQQSALRAEREANQLARERERFALEGAQAGRAARAQRAETMAEDPLYGPSMGPLAGKTQAEKAALHGLLLEEQEREINLARKQGLTRLPAPVMRSPELIVGYLTNQDESFNNYVQEDLGSLQTEISGAIQADPQGFVNAYPNMPENIRREILSAGLTSPAVQQFVSDLVMRSPEYQQAKSNALSRRMYELVQQAPRNENMVESFIDDIRNNPEVYGGWNEDLEQTYHTDPTGLFAELVTGILPTWRPRGYAEQVNEYRAERNRQYMQSFEPTETSVEAPAVEAPAPEPSGLRSNQTNAPERPLSRLAPKKPRAGEYDIRTVDVGTLSVPQRKKAHSQLSDFLLNPLNLDGLSNEEIDRLYGRLQELSGSYEGPIEKFGREASLLGKNLLEDISEVGKRSPEEIERLRVERESKFKAGSGSTIGSPASAAGTQSTDRFLEFVNEVRSVLPNDINISSLNAAPEWLKIAYKRWENDMTLGAKALGEELDKVDWDKVFSVEGFLQSRERERELMTPKLAPYPRRGKGLLDNS